MLSTVSLSRRMIDTLAELSNGVMSLEASGMDPRSKMVPMLSTGGVIGPLIGILIWEFGDEMADIRVAMITGVLPEIVFAAVIILEFLNKVSSS